MNKAEKAFWNSLYECMIQMEQHLKAIREALDKFSQKKVSIF